MDKLELLLDMIEQPERYSEQQILELLADEEVRKHYEVMVRLREAYDMEGKSEREESERMKNEKYKLLFIRKIAAVFIATAFLGGLAFAAYHFLSPRTENQSAEVTAPSLIGRVGGESSPISFSDIRLDSILKVVAAHYGKAVCFRDSTTRELRLSTMWDCEDSLAVFISTLNEFDGLRLKDEGDTLFVESETVEAD